MTMQRDFQYIVNYYNYKNVLLIISINEKTSGYDVYKVSDNSTEDLVIWGHLRADIHNKYYSLYYKLQQVYERISYV